MVPEAFCDKEMSVASLKRFALGKTSQSHEALTFGFSIFQGDDKQSDVDKLSP